MAFQLNFLGKMIEAKVTGLEQIIIITIIAI